MKKLLIMLSLLLSCLTIAGRAAADNPALTIWVDTKAYSEYGDFIIYNNTSYNIGLTSDGWGHGDILKGGDIAPYTARVDSNCYLKGSSANSGTLVIDPLLIGTGWIKINAYTEKSANQTYWSIRVDNTASATAKKGAVAPAVVKSSYARPPTVSNNNMIQLVDGPLVYSYFISYNTDGKNYYTGNTKIVLMISDWTTTDFSQYQATQGWFYP